MSPPAGEPKPRKAKRRKFGFGPGYGHDPFKRTLKPTAAHSPDKRQLTLDPDTATPARRRRKVAVKLPLQIDLEEYISAMGGGGNHD